MGNNISTGSDEALSEILMDSPALEPPPGIIPDFTNPGGQHRIIYGVLITCAILSTICMVVRGYARWTSRLFRLQDGLFLLCWMMYNAWVYLLYDYAIYPGFAVHQWNVPMSELGHLKMLIWIGTLLYGIEMGVLKAAILLDWIQFFSPTRQCTTTVKFIHCWIWANTLFYTITTLADMFQCVPIRKIWDPFYVGGKCGFDINILRVISGAINLVSDAIILGLPQRVIWKLQISRQKKVGVSLLFAVGVFACVSAAIRLYYSYQMAISPDELYTASMVGCWAMAELTAGFLVVGLPSLPKVVKTIAQLKPVESVLYSLGMGSQKEKLSDPGHDHYFERRQPSRARPDWVDDDDPECSTWSSSSNRELRTISKAVRISITSEPKSCTPPITPSEW